MNVIGSRPTGWWRDRRGAMRKLIDELVGLAQRTGEPLTVVLDSKPFDLPGGTGNVEVRFAAQGGRDAADDVIVDIVGADSDPPSLVVATSDKRLADRVRMLGADVISAGTLRRILDADR
jgi:uncharacterized protein YaiI (UPF0178 family)